MNCAVPPETAAHAYRCHPAPDLRARLTLTLAGFAGPPSAIPHPSVPTPCRFCLGFAEPLLDASEARQRRLRPPVLLPGRARNGRRPFPASDAIRLRRRVGTAPAEAVVVARPGSAVLLVALAAAGCAPRPPRRRKWCQPAGAGRLARPWASGTAAGVRGHTATQTHSRQARDAVAEPLTRPAVSRFEHICFGNPRAGPD